MCLYMNKSNTETKFTFIAVFYCKTYAHKYTRKSNKRVYVNKGSSKRFMNSFHISCVSKNKTTVTNSKYTYVCMYVKKYRKTNRHKHDDVKHSHGKNYFNK